MTDIDIVRHVFFILSSVLLLATVPTLIGLLILRKRVREHRHVRYLIMKEQKDMQRELPLEIVQGEYAQRH